MTTTTGCVSEVWPHKSTSRTGGFEQNGIPRGGGFPFWSHEDQHIPKIHRDNAFEMVPKLAAIAYSVAHTYDCPHREPCGEFDFDMVEDPAYDPHVDANHRRLPRCERRLKTLILIHRESGLRTLHHLLTKVYGLSVARADPARALDGEEPSSVVDRNRERHLAFNGQWDSGRKARSNLRGEDTLVFLASAEDLSEGVSFLNVRRIILADLSPGTSVPSWALVKQRVGRALRACSHRDLPADERTLRVSLFVAVHDNPYYPPTLDFEKLQIVERQMEDVEKGMEQLRCASVDAAYYNEKAPPCFATPGRPSSSLSSGLPSLSSGDDYQLPMYDDQGLPTRPTGRQHRRRGCGIM